MAEDEVQPAIEEPTPMGPEKTETVDPIIEDLRNSAIANLPIPLAPPDLSNSPGQPIGLPGQPIPQPDQPSMPPNPTGPVELDEETRNLIGLTPEERAALNKEQEEARRVIKEDSAHDNPDINEPEEAPEQEIPEGNQEAPPTEERLGKKEIMYFKGEEAVGATVGNEIDPQDPAAPRLGNWDLNIPGMEVKARSNDRKNEMELIWDKAALPTSSKTTPSIAKITKPECVVEETPTTSKISCVLPKPDKNLDNVKFTLNHLTVNVKNELGGLTRMDVIWDKAASPTSQSSTLTPSVAPTLP